MSRTRITLLRTTRTATFAVRGGATAVIYAPGVGPMRTARLVYVLACIAVGGCSSSAQPGLEVDDTALPSGYVGRAYVASIAVVGPAPSDVRWSITAGTLPPGLMLGDPSGPSVNVQGTPASGGDFLFTIAAEAGARR